MGKEAKAFSTIVNYVTGDLVMRGGVLFEFTQNHNAGAWNGSHVKRVDDNTEQKVSRVLAVYKRLTEATAFANSIVFEPSLIAENRYKYTLTN